MSSTNSVPGQADDMLVHPVQAREEHDDSRRHRVLRLLFWVAIAVVTGAVLQLFGVDVIGWLDDVWENLQEISPIYILIGIAFKSLESMFTAVSWRTILRAAYPKQNIKYKTVLGAYQGGVGINQIAPAKAGTWAMLGLYHLYIPGSRFATLLSAFVVQSLAFTFFGALIWVALIFTQPDSATDQFSAPGTISGFISDHTFITLILVAAIVFLGFTLFNAYRSKIGDLKKQLTVGGQIFQHPKHYLLGAFLPAFVAYTCRWVYTGVFMAAFDIPVSLRTIFLVIASNSVANALAVTPGGAGTTQVANVAALKNYAPADVVTAYSIAQGVIISAWNIVFGVITMTWAFGWGQTKDLVRNRKEITAQMQAAQAAEEAQDPEQGGASETPNSPST